MKKGKLILIVLVLLFSVGCDQATKIAARTHLEGQPAASYLGDLFRLTYAENSGAFLGMGSSLPDSVRLGMFVVFVCIALTVGLVWLFRRRETLSRPMLLATTLMIGGGIGNLIDRVLFDGRVTDFMSMGVAGVRTGIFNVADIWIMFGIGLMFFAPEFWRKPEKSEAETS